MGKYWNGEQDELVEVINNTSGTTQQRAINELYPALEMMGEAILNRYFRGSFNPWEYKDIVTEAISRVIQKLHMFNPERAKSFSFCQTIIRNFYLTKLVKTSEKERRWKETINEDPKIIDPEFQTSYGYVDHNIEREIVPMSDVMLEHLYKIKVDTDYADKYFNNHRQYERVKLSLKRPKYKFLVAKLKTLVDTMIAILEEDSDIGYERFLIELHLRTGFNQYTLKTTTEMIDMYFPDAAIIIRQYRGYRENKNPEPETGVLSKLDQDKTPKDKHRKGATRRQQQDYYRRKKEREA